MPRMIDLESSAGLLEALAIVNEYTQKSGYSFAQKAGTASGTPSTPYLHGPGGIFGVAGIERDVLSTHVAPRGLLSALPAVPSVDATPYFAYVTGFAAATGTNPSGVCDDPMTAGAIKGCLQTAQFGRYSFQTREIEVNHVGLRINRGEMGDLRLINADVLAGGPLSAMGTTGGSLSLGMNDEMLARMKEVGVAFERQLAQQLWEGNPANNSGGGGYKEFPGMEILVGTAKYDAIAGTACPSLASRVMNNNYRLVSNDPSGAGGIIETMTYIAYTMERLAEVTNLAPVTWAWVMRPSLFYEITSVWACAYLTYRCTVAGAGNQAIVDSADAVGLRDAMRNGRYLMIDGVQWPVILDDSITEDTNTTNANVPNPTFASDIYLIPLRIRGNYLATYLEYLDYQQGAMAAIEQAHATDEDWTDSGRFLWHKKVSVNWCKQLLAKIEPRLILRTPHLAARIQNVRYASLLHERDSQPTSGYWVDGGVSAARSVTAPFSEWNVPG